MRDRTALDIVEVMVEDGFASTARVRDWQRIGARWPLISHGTELGPGDAEGVQRDYLAQVQQVLGTIGTQWHSDHLCFLRSDRDHVGLGSFGPLALDDHDLHVLKRNLAEVHATIRGHVLLENPADVLGFAGSDGAKLGRDYARALSAAGVGGLLDVTNLALNARNDGFDPLDFLQHIAWDRVIEVHLAGGRLAGGLWIDSHDHPVDEESWALLSVVVQRAPHLRAVIIERDDRLPPLETLLAEVDRARGVVGR